METNNNSVPSGLMNLEETMKDLRIGLKDTGDFILSIKTALSTTPANAKEDRGEELANLTLAYRHLEDCIMRLGKVIQAFNGGENPNMPK